MKYLLIAPFLFMIFFIGYNKKVYFVPAIKNNSLEVTRHSINSSEFPRFFLKVDRETIPEAIPVWINFVFFALLMAFSAVMVIKLYFQNPVYLKFSLWCYFFTYSMFLVFLIIINLLPNNSLSVNLLVRFRNLLFTPIIEMVLFLGFFFLDQSKKNIKASSAN